MKKKLLRYAIAFPLLIGGYLLFMLLACLVPDKPVQRNIARSLSPFMHQGDYPYAIFEKQGCKMDNFTDALILNIAYNISTDSLKTSLFRNPYHYTDIYMNVNLENTIKQSESQTRYYPRYWHGSSFLLRFLLLLGNYEHIRQLFYAVSMVLLLILASLIYREAAPPYMVGFFSGFVLLHGFVTQMSIQFFPVLAITFVASIAICRKWKDFSSVCMTLFVAGSFTAFFDLLTTPLLTLGLPLLLYFILNRNNEQTWMRTFGETAELSVTWIVGYTVTWATKWGISTLVTGRNVFLDAAGSVMYRSHRVDGYSRWDALAVNLQQLNFPLILALVVAAAILALLFFNKRNIKTALLCLITATSPYVWYFAIANHSQQHFWFTYRLQMIAISGVVLFFICLTDWQKIAALELPFRKSRTKSHIEN